MCPLVFQELLFVREKGSPWLSLVIVFVCVSEEQIMKRREQRKENEESDV